MRGKGCEYEGLRVEVWGVKDVSMRGKGWDYDG